MESKVVAVKIMSRVEVKIKTNAFDIIYNALKVDEDKDRSKAKLYLTKDGLLLKIEAEDLTALRSAINVWLRLIKMCDEIIEVLV